MENWNVPTWYTGRIVWCSVPSQRPNSGQTENAFPPMGEFVTVEGIRLHYIESAGYTLSQKK
jgi:hypothetical protein